MRTKYGRIHGLFFEICGGSYEMVWLQKLRVGAGADAQQLADHASVCAADICKMKATEADPMRLTSESRLSRALLQVLVFFRAQSFHWMLDVAQLVGFGLLAHGRSLMRLRSSFSGPDPLPRS